VFTSSFASNLARVRQKLATAFGDYALGQTQTYDWFSQFKNGRTFWTTFNRHNAGKCCKSA
jgi:hypothetical protein